MLIQRLRRTIKDIDDGLKTSSGCDNLSVCLIEFLP